MAKLIWKKRVVKESVKHGIIFLVVVIFVPTILDLVNVSSGMITSIIALIVLASLALRLIPKGIYCSDCGQYLGKDNNYNIPCKRCDCNIYSYTQPGAGKTVKHR